ncbi:MAG: hypothetical protein CM15mV3_0470 [Caudoviricetes sp.]|nr:MAG: hypothetical protein CM15mV3_0470 [Caudoviricetes sp.]
MLTLVLEQRLLTYHLQLQQVQCICKWYYDVLLQSGSFVEGEQFSYITSAGAGSAYNLTATEQRGDNTLRFTTDPTGTIPGGTVVQIVATPSSGSPFTGFYEVATIDSTQSASNIWDVTFVPILNAPSWSGNGIAGTYTINQATPQTETIDTTKIKSIRAEGEVVSVDEDYTTTLPISRIDFSLQEIQALQLVVSRVLSLVMQKTLVVLYSTLTH